MDPYQVLGVDRDASKEEIKQAFHRLAKQFHPDKHSQTSDRSIDSATFKFKQISEAYETLIDDRKRADYNFTRKAYGSRNRRYEGDYSYRNSHGYGATKRGGESMFYRFETGLRYLTTRSFLLNASFACILVGGIYLVDEGSKALWKMHNPGKSFEEAVEKAKSFKDDIN